MKINKFQVKFLEKKKIKMKMKTKIKIKFYKLKLLNLFIIKVKCLFIRIFKSKQIIFIKDLIKEVLL